MCRALLRSFSDSGSLCSSLCCCLLRSQQHPPEQEESEWAGQEGLLCPGDERRRMMKLRSIMDNSWTPLGRDWGVPSATDSDLPSVGELHTADHLLPSDCTTPLDEQVIRNHSCICLYLWLAFLFLCCLCKFLLTETYKVELKSMPNTHSHTMSQSPVGKSIIKKH